MTPDPASLARLGTVCPAIRRAVYAALAAGTQEGLAFRVAQGLRTGVEQDKLYAQGRSLPGKIVTNARGGESSHNFGMAIDCYPFVSGQSGPLVWDASSPRFRQMVFLLKAQGLLWGGDWKTLIDAPHFYVGPASPSARDRTLFAQGGTQAVWDYYGVG